MTKHSNHLQAVDLPKTMAVEIPLPLLGAFANIEKSFFELCIDTGQQVLQAMTEQDREDLCGPRGIRLRRRLLRGPRIHRTRIALGGVGG
jgi:hypothetical protein